MVNCFYQRYDLLKLLVNNIVNCFYQRYDLLKLLVNNIVNCFYQRYDLLLKLLVNDIVNCFYQRYDLLNLLVNNIVNCFYQRYDLLKSDWTISLIRINTVLGIYMVLHFLAKSNFSLILIRNVFTNLAVFAPQRMPLWYAYMYVHQYAYCSITHTQSLLRYCMNRLFCNCVLLPTYYTKCFIILLLTLFTYLAISAPSPVILVQYLHFYFFPFALSFTFA